MHSPETHDSSLSPSSIRDLHSQAIGLSSNSQSNWLALGRVLLQIKNQRLYKSLGFSNFQDYLKKGGFHRKNRSLYNFIKLAEYPYIDLINHYPYALCLKLIHLSDVELLVTLQNLDGKNATEKFITISRAMGKGHLQRLNRRRETTQQTTSIIDLEIKSIVQKENVDP